MIERASISDYNVLIDIWDSAVSATHDFLKKEDFLFYKSQLPLYFKYVDLFVYKDAHSGLIRGFLGVTDDKIEMLFVSNEYRRVGIGKKLLEFAVNSLHLTKVDVNEENTTAMVFYKKFGFRQIGYSEIDQEGRNYPIVYMGL